MSAEGAGAEVTNAGGLTRNSDDLTTLTIEQVLGREIDLVSYGGLKPKLDDDIRREAVLL